MHGPSFKMQMIQVVTKHTYIQDIKVQGNTIFVGDMMRGLSVFTYKEASQLPHLANTAAAQPKLLACSKSPHCQWLTSVLPLNEAQAMTFDRNRNMLVYERVLTAANDQAKRRVEAVAGIKWDEYITKAVIGQLTSPSQSAASTGSEGDRKYLKKPGEEDTTMRDEEEKKQEVIHNH